jgi:hypothetical protein
LLPPLGLFIVSAEVFFFEKGKALGHAYHKLDWLLVSFHYHLVDEEVGSAD